MTDKSALKLLHEHLKDCGKWYIEVTAPDVEEFEEIADKARGNADYMLPRMSFHAFYTRYLRWKEQVEETVGDDTFKDFLDCLVFNLCLNSLEGTERTIFEDSCNATVRWML